MTFLDEFVYPFHLPEAQYLHEVLTGLYPGDGALLAARQAEIATGMISANQGPTLLWKDILDEASRTGLLRALVQSVHDRLNDHSPVKPFLSDLLADRPTATPGEPRDPVDGAPSFVHDDDVVTEHEAMLFEDDLTVPIGKVPSLILTLQKLVTLAPAVCKLTVDFNGTGQFGTAFRIGDNTLLTNWHVLHSKKDATPATAVTAEFGLDDDGAGGLIPATTVACDPASAVSNKVHDWAVIDVKDPLNSEWPLVRLSERAVPTLASLAYIVQHPGGQRKRVAMVRNKVSKVDDNVVHYLTDTDIGSSGSPVFDADGRLIALHHAGGRPQSVLGSALRKNEGILISRVAADLADKGMHFQ